jgi:hypothetical protein
MLAKYAAAGVAALALAACAAGHPGQTVIGVRNA